MADLANFFVGFHNVIVNASANMLRISTSAIGTDNREMASDLMEVLCTNGDSSGERLGLPVCV
jgi:hypothetical protein